MIEPFLSALPVLKKLEEEGYEAYFVGGSVRDYLLSKPINDIDIASSATPEEVKKVFSKTIDIGIEHGTVLVLFGKQSYEVTTFRTEAEYLDFRRPKEVRFIRSLQEDLGRRDFTMNAIAMDRKGNLIDPFSGRLAIKKKIIQTVGNPFDRFQEDALRMIRAVRFESQLSFEMESETERALSKLVHLLENIAIERKRAEFEKLLVGKSRKKAIKRMIKTNMYSYLPGLDHQLGSLRDLLSYEIGELNKVEMWSMLIYCLKLTDKPIETFLRNWRLPLKEIREIQAILYYLTKRLEKEWSVRDLFSANRKLILTVEQLYHVIHNSSEQESINKWLEVYDQLPIKDRSEIAVTGE